MNSLDDVWAQMKMKAAEYAANGAVPTQDEAQQFVTSLLFAAGLNPRPTRKVVDFYAREFVELTRKELDKDFV